MCLKKKLFTVLFIEIEGEWDNIFTDESHSYTWGSAE